MKKPWYKSEYLQIKGYFYFCSILLYLILSAFLLYKVEIGVAFILKYPGMLILFFIIIGALVFLWVALMLQERTFFTEVTKIAVQFIFFLVSFYILYIILFKIYWCPFGEEPFQDYLFKNRFFDVKYVWGAEEGWDIYHMQIELCCTKYNIPLSDLDNRTFKTDEIINQAFSKEEPMKFIDEAVSNRSKEYQMDQLLKPKLSPEKEAARAARRAALIQARREQYNL
jgi:hypothetical protein